MHVRPKYLEQKDDVSIVATRIFVRVKVVIRETNKERTVFKTSTCALVSLISG